jgi:hypothetical protein
MTGKKGQPQPKGHTWVFSHEEYTEIKGTVYVIKVEKCVTPRHKHATRKTPLRKLNDKL